jgi:acyl-CoA thioester hydrolase
MLPSTSSSLSFAFSSSWIQQQQRFFSSHGPSSSSTSSRAILEKFEEKLEELKKEYPVFIRIPVKWGEMDAFGHLNNVAMFRYFESGRISWLHQMRRYIGEEEYQATMNSGSPPSSSSSVGIILKDSYCNYRSPVFFPDTLLVFTRVPLANIKEDRFKTEYVSLSRRSGAIVAEGSFLSLLSNLCSSSSSLFLSSSSSTSSSSPSSSIPLPPLPLCLLPLSLS